MRTAVKIILGIVLISLAMVIIFGLVLLLSFIPELLNIKIFEYSEPPSGIFILDLFMNRWVDGAVTFIVLFIFGLLFCLGYFIVDEIIDYYE
jgi:hypothetical protein